MKREQCSLFFFNSHSGTRHSTSISIKERWKSMKKVLICDDAAFMRNVLKGFIEKEGFEIVGEATNGNEAVIQYKTLKPDIVTMDITMPEKDGLTALKEIMGLNSDAKVVMCSAMGQKAMVLDAIKSGAKDFIVKPFERERVLETLKKL